MCPMSCIFIVGILGLSSYAVGTVQDLDYASEDANAVVNVNSRNCGNGKLDPAEECDPGPLLDDPCCHRNCQLKLHSQCSNNDPCCEKCTFKPRGAICHKATHECGIPEYCSGNKGDCPATSYKRNGANCTGEFGKGMCVYGVCKSFALPCHQAWKSSETEPVRELTKCSAATICLNQTCVPIRDLVLKECPKNSLGEECSSLGECTASYHCHCIPGWRGHDCSTSYKESEGVSSLDRPGVVKGQGPEQRDSKSNTTALVGGLVGFVIVVSVIFVVMAFRYLPARIPKDDNPVYPTLHAETIDCEADGPNPNIGTIAS